MASQGGLPVLITLIKALIDSVDDVHRLAGAQPLGGVGATGGMVDQAVTLLLLLCRSGVVQAEAVAQLQSAGPGGEGGGGVVEGLVDLLLRLAARSSNRGGSDEEEGVEGWFENLTFGVLGSLFCLLQV